MMEHDLELRARYLLRTGLTGVATSSPPSPPSHPGPPNDGGVMCNNEQAYV